MDGAIILDEKGEHIWRANAQLQPLSELKSDETEFVTAWRRTAAQTGAIVIAVSPASVHDHHLFGTKKIHSFRYWHVADEGKPGPCKLWNGTVRIEKELDNLSVLEFDDMVLC